MKLKITGEQPFQISGAHSCGISASASGYILQYSVDGVTYNDWSEAVPANENCLVINFPKFTFFKLKNNTGDVIVNY